jgi:glycosyltransferase involved in cell wall biosynthesis
MQGVRLRIVVTGTRGFPNVQGGVENHCEKLYTHMIRKGCDITVFTRTPYMAPDCHQYKGISLVPVTCPQNKFLEALVHTFKSVLKARKLKPDLLHIHAIGPSLFTPLARILGMKVVVTSHGPDYMRMKWSKPARMFLRFCEWMGMYFADEVIAIAGNIADDIKRKYNREAAVIPNGVEMPHSVTSYEYLESIGLRNKKYILAVGRFVPEKGFDDLIDAFCNCGFKDWHLVIAGDADHEDKYSKGLKIKAGKDSRIFLTGFLSRNMLGQLYTYAGLFVLPSYHEGLPIVLLEAMSYGVSCIASDIPANRNVELSEERFFKAGDVEMLTAKIREFINNPLREREKQKQVNMINTKYNWDKIADDTLTVYRKALARTLH